MKARRGFTLIELMVVVLVVAILAGLAISSYTKQVRKSRRAEAKQLLIDVSLRQEKWRSNHTKYAGMDSVAAVKTAFGIPLSSGTYSGSYYTLAVTTNESPTAYTVTATPKLDQLNDACGTLTLRVVTAGTVEKLPTTVGCW